MTVDGSFLTEVYATLKMMDGALVQVSYVHRVVHVELVDASSGVVLVTTPLTTDMGVVTFGDITVAVTHPATLTVTDAHWQIHVTPGTHRLASDGSRQMHLDVGVIALTDPLLSRVAPHGIIGQGFNDLHQRQDQAVVYRNIHHNRACEEGHAVGDPDLVYQTVPAGDTSGTRGTTRRCTLLFFDVPWTSPPESLIPESLRHFRSICSRSIHFGNDHSSVLMYVQFLPGSHCHQQKHESLKNKGTSIRKEPPETREHTKSVPS